MGVRHAVVMAGLALGLLTARAEAAPITFAYTGGLQNYTISTSGIYNLVAFGAQGGSSNSNGGRGAEIGGDFRFSAGDQLVIAVGRAGVGGTPAAGGGGGTFVVSQSGIPLVIAGGGGGAGGYGDGGNGLAGQSGGDSLGASGGTAGMGGGAGTGNNADAGGGGGYLGPGTNGQGAFYVGQGGQGYPDLTGGAGSKGGAGGFGGGGGGAVLGGGGGGGYSGGAGSITEVGGFGLGGGGGGSFLSELALFDSDRVLLSGVNLGDGSLTLNLVSSVPLPASAPMFGAALLALGAVSYGVKRKRAAVAA